MRWNKRRLIAELQHDLDEARSQVWRMVNQEWDLRAENKLLRTEVKRLKDAQSTVTS